MSKIPSWGAWQIYLAIQFRDVIGEVKEYILMLNERLRGCCGLQPGESGFTCLMKLDLSKKRQQVP